MRSIIHITTFLQGGAGKIICDLIENQVAQGYTVICITNKQFYYSYFNYPEYELKLNQMGVKLLKINGLFKRDVNEFKQATQAIIKLLEKTTVDIIHSHSATPSKVSMMALKFLELNIPIINTMHGWGKNKTKEQENDDLSTLSKVGIVVAVSKTSKQLLIKKGICKEHITVIYNGLSSTNDSNNNQNKLFHDERLNGSFVIGCIGTICDRKNQALIIQSVNELSMENNVHCVFIGEDDNQYSNELKKHVLDIGLKNNITFTGYLEKADQYISNFDLFILPTRAEGLPLSIIEAFRESTLVAASDVPECCELVKHNITGLIFDVENHLSLTTTINNAMKLDKVNIKKITDKAYSFYQEELNQNKMLKQYNDLYSSMI